MERRTSRKEPSELDVPRSRNKKEHPIVEAAFSLLYAMTQGNHINPSLGFFIHIVEDVQLLSFAFRPHHGFNHMPTWMPLVFNPMAARPADNSSFKVLFYVAFTITFCSALLTIIVGTSMKGSQMKVVWPLHVLRILTTLISTVLLIPMMEIFLHSIACYDFDTEMHWLTKNLSVCFTREYLPQFVLGITGVAYLSLQAPLIAAVFFTIIPGDKDPHSKTTGRIDAMYNVFRLVLAILLGLMEHAPTLMLVCLILASAAMLYCTCRFQPFFVGPMNDLRSGIFAASLGSGLQAVIVYGSTHTDSYAPFATLCVLLVPEFLVGFLLCRRVRFALAQGVYTRLRASRPVNSVAKRVSRSMSFKKHRSPSIRQSASMDGENEDLDLEGNMLENMHSIVKKRNAEPIQVFLNEADVELACRFLQHNTDMDARYLANTILTAGLEQFPKAPSLHLLRAHYIATYQLAAFDEISHSLEAAKAMKPAFDVRFLIFFEECSVEQDRRKEDLLASSLNVAGYAEFNSMEADAQRYHLETLIAIKALWLYMRNEKQAAGSLPFLLERIENNRYRAIQVYKKILSKYPRSKQTLRRYSNFLLRATDNIDQAKKLLSRAEEIENDELRYGSLAAARDEEAQVYEEREPKVTVLAPGESISRLESFRMNAGESTNRMVSEETTDTKESGSDDGIAMGEDAGTRRRRTRIQSFNENEAPRRISFAAPKLPMEPSLTEVMEPAHRKKGGSVVPSSVSSQREARQMRFLKEAITRRLRAPIVRFHLFMNIGLTGIIAILGTGCALGILAYQNITGALAEA
ncbi:hypothetical protein DFJ77DRAFT_132542 [Powellomyces hirtus]|nr:hypothetical protein DFJ77DRAFT_132542 [Powellomyces hirtus]